MTSALITAIADNMTDLEVENMVGNYYSHQLFSIVSRTADIVDSDQKAVALNAVNSIITSPVLAAMPIPIRVKLKALCDDAKELIEMDPMAE